MLPAIFSCDHVVLLLVFSSVRSFGTRSETSKSQRKLTLTLQFPRPPQPPPPPSSPMTNSFPKLKLTYFDGALRAELTRLVLTVGGVPFEDHRVDYGQFMAMRASLPQGKLPILEVDGIVYPQAPAHALFAARLTGLYPSDPLAALRIDMLYESLRELLNAYIDIKWFTPDEDHKMQRIDRLLSDRVPLMLGLLDKKAAETEGDFLHGAEVSLIDLFAFDIVTNTLQPNYADRFDVDAYPRVATAVKKVAQIPRVAEYLAKHKDTAPN